MGVEGAVGDNDRFSILPPESELLGATSAEPEGFHRTALDARELEEFAVVEIEERGGAAGVGALMDHAY